MHCLSYRKLVVEVVVIKLSPESKPSIVHNTDIMNIIAIASFVVRLKQDVSCLRRCIKCDIKLKRVACSKLIDRC